MKIAIIGAGAMGTVLGAYLYRGGADVTLYGLDNDHLQTIRDRGFTYRHTEGGEETFPLRVALAPEEIGVQDYLIVMVKGPDTQAAVQGVLGCVGEHTYIVTLQNGLGNVEIISALVPPQRVLYGCLNMSAIQLAPGLVSGNLFDEINVHLGAHDADAAQKQAGEQLAALFTAGGAPALWDEQIDRQVWSKALVNMAVNAPCALVRLTGGDAGKNPQFALMVVDIIKETIAVAEALGVQGLDFTHFMTRTLPAARKASSGHYPSMMHDMLFNKRPTEIEFLNGYVEKTGKQLGVPTPVNATIARLVRTIEGAYSLQWEPGQQQ